MHLPITTLITIILLVSVAAASFAAPGDEHWDDRFGPPGVEGEVKVLTASGTDLYAGGDFVKAGAVPVNHIARWSTAKNKWYPLADGVDGTVMAIAIDGDNVYVGGQFLHAGSVAANNLAVYHIASNSWTALGDGVSGDRYAYVASIAVSGSYVYIGGRFSAIGTILANNIARWNGTDFERLGTGATDPVNVIVRNGNDLYVGGAFTSAGSIASRHIARFNGANWFALDTGTNGPVNAIAVDGNSVYIGGQFFVAGKARTENIARWDIPTSSFSSMGTGVSLMDPSVRGYVSAIAIAGGKIVIGGLFRRAGRDTLLARHIARWSVTDSNWVAMRPSGPRGADSGGRGVSSTPQHGSSSFAVVNSIVFFGDDPYLGGVFDHAYMRVFPPGPGSDGVSVGFQDLNVVRWNTGSDVWRSLGDSPNGPLTSVAANESNIVVAGHFTSAGGVVSNNAAIWNTLSHEWMPMDTGLGWTGNTASAVAAAKNYFAALYNSVYEFFPGQPRWTALPNLPGAITSLAASGDTVVAGFANGVFVSTGSSWIVADSAASLSIRAVTAGNDVYAGGRFDSIGGIHARNIARWNVATRSWKPLGSGTNGVVYSITVSGGSVYVGGKFDSAGTVAARNIALWDNTAETWSPLGGSVAGPVNALAMRNSSLYAGGNFAVVGDNVPASNVARWDGENWSELGSGTNGPVTGLASTADGVYAVGSFTLAGGKLSNGIAKWNDDLSSVGETVREGSTYRASSSLISASISPNPVSFFTQFRIVNNSVSAISSEVLVCDALGTKVRQLTSVLAPGSNTIDFFANGMPDGMYFLVLKSMTGVISIPFIVAR